MTNIRKLMNELRRFIHFTFNLKKKSTTNYTNFHGLLDVKIYTDFIDYYVSYVLKKPRITPIFTNYLM